MRTPQAETIEIAEKMLAGEVELVDGCRRLVQRLRSAGLADDPDAITIFGIESETDHLPAGAERNNWDPAILAAKDRERDEYLDRVRSKLLAACRAIIGRLSPS
jgi:hypothetical protein